MEWKRDMAGPQPVLLATTRDGGHVSSVLRLASRTRHPGLRGADLPKGKVSVSTRNLGPGCQS